MKQKLEMNDIELHRTEDSSVTFFHKALGAHYRSIHGADTESNHVFVQGTRILEQQECRIIELGFGAATNFRNLLQSCSSHHRVHYLAIEHQPIPPALLDGQDLGSQLAISALQEVRRTGEAVRIEKDNIILELLPTDIFRAELPQNWANACFHDPFGPKVNPESWSAKCFSLLYRAMSENGILSTYGAAGHAKRAMVAAGFWIASGPGYGRKREITYAAKDPKQIAHGILNTRYQPD